MKSSDAVMKLRHGGCARLADARISNCLFGALMQPSDWTVGYVADIAYTHGYYTELNPLRLPLAFLNAGLAVPEVATACELGFGQGVSINLHAAASSTHWHGTDFNPSQVAGARELARNSGAGAVLRDDAFSEYISRSDLPDFDFICMHGIWSWISDENRSVIVDFLRRKLKVGGVLYISYNTLPGWADFAPMRHLLTQHAARMGAQGAGVAKRIEGALDFANRLNETAPLFLRACTSVPARLEKMSKQSLNYIAHEYFNADWHPMYFSDMTKWLEPAKLTYACSAHLLDAVPELHLTSAQIDFLGQLQDVSLRETTRDFMVNQQFRKDYWVKGPRKLNPVAQAEAFRSLRFVLVSHPNEVPKKLATVRGEAVLNSKIYPTVLATMAHHQPLSLAQIEQACAGQHIAFDQILQAVTLLLGIDAIAPVQNEKDADDASTHSSAINGYIQQQSRHSADFAHLASPVTGGGIIAGRLALLFLLALSEGNETPEQWAQYAMALMTAQGQKMFKDGSSLDSPEEILAELRSQAQSFGERKLPIFKALGIV